MERIIFLFVLAILILLVVFLKPLTNRNLSGRQFVALLTAIIAIGAAFYLFQFGTLSDFTLRTFGTEAKFTRDKVQQITEDSETVTAIKQSVQQSARDIAALKTDSEKRAKEIASLVDELKTNQYEISEATSNILALHSSASTVRNQVDELSAKLHSSVEIIYKKTAELLQIVDDANQEIEVLQLYFSAHGGDWSAYQKLTSRAVGTSKCALLAASMSDDLWLYVEYVRLQVGQRTYLNSLLLSQIHPPAETVLKDLRGGKNLNERLTAISEMSGTKRPYYVEALVQVANDPNWKLQVSSARALELILDRKFDTHPPIKQVSDWWEKSGSTNSAYKSFLGDYDNACRLSANGQVDQAIPLFEAIVKDRPDAGESRRLLAQCYLFRGAKDDRQKAESLLKQAVECCDGVYAGVAYAELLLQDGSTQDALSILKRVKSETTQQIYEESIAPYPNIKKFIETKEYKDGISQS